MLTVENTNMTQKQKQIRLNHINKALYDITKISELTTKLKLCIQKIHSDVVIQNIIDCNKSLKLAQFWLDKTIKYLLVDGIEINNEHQYSEYDSFMVVNNLTLGGRTCRPMTVVEKCEYLNYELDIMSLQINGVTKQIVESFEQSAPLNAYVHIHEARFSLLEIIKILTDNANKNTTN